MIPDYYVPDNTEIHIGGFDRCECDGNPNIGCVLQLVNIHLSKQKSLILTVGECIFCKRLFACIDWSLHKERILEEIKSMVKVYENLLFVFHPMNQTFTASERSNHKIYREFLGAHRVSGQMCEFYQINTLRDAFLPIHKGNYTTMLYVKECPKCGSYFAIDNIKLSGEFDGYLESLRSLKRFFIYRAKDFLVWNGVLVGKDFYYGYDDKGTAFISNGKILRDKTVIVQIKKYGSKGWQDKKYPVKANVISQALYDKYIKQERAQERAKRIEARTSSYNSLSYVNNRHRGEKFVDYDGVSKKPFQGGDFSPD